MKITDNVYALDATKGSYVYVIHDKRNQGDGSVVTLLNKWYLQ